MTQSLIFFLGFPEAPNDEKGLLLQIATSLLVFTLSVNSSIVFLRMKNLQEV